MTHNHTNLYRKRSSHKDNSKKSNIAVSANMAYGEESLKPGMPSMEGEYENPDKILRTSGQMTAASNYETIIDTEQTTSALRCR